MLPPLRLILLLFFLIAASQKTTAQELPWQPDFAVLEPIIPTAEGKKIKSENQYLKIKKRLLPLQIKLYDIEGLSSYALHFRYDSLNNTTHLNDSIVYNYKPALNSKFNLHKMHFLKKHTKWEMQREEYYIHQKDTLIFKALTTEGDTLQILKLTLNSNGFPIFAKGIVNVDQLNNNYNYYFEYNDFFRFIAFFNPRRNYYTYHPGGTFKIEGSDLDIEKRERQSLKSVEGFYTYFWQHSNNFDLPINKVLNHYYSTLPSTPPNYSITYNVTMESLFKYKRNHKLAYRLDYAVTHRYGFWTEIEEYSPNVLLFYKIKERSKNINETEQIIYPLKRTNKVKPSYGSSEIDYTIVTCNLDKVKYHTIGKPIIISKFFSFY